VVKSQSLLDRRSGLQMQLGVPGSACNTPGCADDKPGSTWERRRQAWEHLGALATHLGALATHLGAHAKRLGTPRTSLGACQITIVQSGKNIFFVGNAAGAPGNHSHYISFNDF